MDRSRTAARILGQSHVVLKLRWVAVKVLDLHMFLITMDMGNTGKEQVTDLMVDLMDKATEHMQAMYLEELCKVNL